jgi:hypothetical protein
MKEMYIVRDAKVGVEPLIYGALNTLDEAKEFIRRLEELLWEEYGEHFYLDYDMVRVFDSVDDAVRYQLAQRGYP